MDREALRRAAANRRSDAAPKKQTVQLWRCEFCLRDYQTGSKVQVVHRTDLLLKQSKQNTGARPEKLSTISSF